MVAGPVESSADDSAFVAPASRDLPCPAETTPTFSVVIAAYQAVETVADAVQSALSQTHPPLEVIVCDDGSTDGTGSALAQFGSTIRVIRQPNGGEAAAKNAAVRAAQGKYVAILDADDLYFPARLERLGALATRRPDLDVLTTDAVLEVDGFPVRRCYDDTWPFEVANQRSAILKRNFVFGLAAVRRSRLLEAGGFDERLRYAADWDCWIRMILSGSQVGLVAEPLARYRLRAGSLSAERGALLQGRAVVLERAAARGGLTASERASVIQRAAINRREAAVARAFEALDAGAPDARAHAARVARDGGNALPTRLRAAAAVVAPGVCRLLLRRRTNALGRPGPAGVRLPSG
jgi:Glycosyl transferase family 2